MQTSLRILVAQHQLGDIVLLKHAFSKAQVQMPVHFTQDGKDVMDYLEGRPPFDDPVRWPLPNLLLLDLKLPVVDGFEVLEWLRKHPRLSQMLVVVFSSSDREEDLRRARASGANSYIVKPSDPAELVDVVRRIEAFWLGIGAPGRHPDFDLSAFQGTCRR